MVGKKKPAAPRKAPVATQDIMSSDIIPATQEESEAGQALDDMFDDYGSQDSTTQMSMPVMDTPPQQAEEEAEEEEEESQAGTSSEATGTTTTTATTSSGKKRRSYLTLSPERERELAEWYGSHEQLYNKKLQAYRDTGKKQALYREQAARVELTREYHICNLYISFRIVMFIDEPVQCNTDTFYCLVLYTRVRFGNRMPFHLLLQLSRLSCGSQA